VSNNKEFAVIFPELEITEVKTFGHAGLNDRKECCSKVQSGYWSRLQSPDRQVDSGKVGSIF